MERRINYISQLHITSSVYKAMIGINLSPHEAKQIIQAIEVGVNAANAYDESLNKGVELNAERN